MVLYKTRYRAEKARREAGQTGTHVVVRVSGGWTLMSHADYRVWQMQR